MPPDSTAPALSLGDRCLRALGDVRPGESGLTLLLLSNIFVLMVAYYVIKVVREALVLTTGVEGLDGPQLKTFAAAVQALVLMFAIPVYGWISSRSTARQLTRRVTLFFIVSIQVFYLLALLELPLLGFLFYVWVGIFSVVSIAQFWSYANDICSKEVGERLFPIIAVGATGGAFFGSKLSSILSSRDLGSYDLLEVGALTLVVQLLLYVLLQRRPDVHSRVGVLNAAAADANPIGGLGGFELVARSRYLRLIALLLIMLNLVNTTGEYILSAFATEEAEAALSLALLADPGLDPTTFLRAFYGSFYGSFFFYVNWFALLSQAFVVSRLFRLGGMAAIVLALPVVALGGYALIALGAGYGIVRFTKTAENATDYSVMNTAKAMLWLPTSRAEKYKAKQAIDTFFVRLGDVLALGVVMIGSELLGLSYRGFAAANVAVASMWLVVAFLLYREYRKLGEGAADPAPR